MVTECNEFGVCSIQRIKSWWKNDCETREDSETESLTCSYELSQLISDPTHIAQHSSSCIDLIFTNQLNFIIDNGLQSSLHPNCHESGCIFKIQFKNRVPTTF